MVLLLFGYSLTIRPAKIVSRWKEQTVDYIP